MKITTQVISPFLEHKWVHKHFPKHFSSRIIKEKLKLFFFLTNGPAHENALAHDRFRPDPLRGEVSRRPGSGFRPTAVWPRETKGEKGWPCHAGALGVMAVRRPPVSNGHFWPRSGEMERAQGARGNGKHTTAAQGEKGGARVSAAERELDGSGHGGARGNAQSSLTVASKTAWWLVQRSGGGGGV
jgi:hypothetical protein